MQYTLTKQGPGVTDHTGGNSAGNSWARAADSVREIVANAAPGDRIDASIYDADDQMLDELRKDLAARGLRYETDADGCSIVDA